MYIYSFCESLVSVSTKIGRYCTKTPISVIPVFGSYMYLQLENTRYQYYQYIPNRASLILIKEFSR